MTVYTPWLGVSILITSFYTRIRLNPARRHHAQAVGHEERLRAAAWS
jgi:hypothetical protein